MIPTSPVTGPPADWGQGYVTVAPTLRTILRDGFPHRGLSVSTNHWRRANRRHLLGSLAGVLWASLRPSFGGRVQSAGALYLRVYRGDTGQVEELGLAAIRLVTTAGVNFLVDAWQNTTELENLRFHGYGTGVAAEATGDTALGTEETTQYNPDNTRPTGTLAEGASANIFRTVGTYTPDSGGTRAITEHGVFSQAATGGGTLWDRSVFSVVNLNSVNGDSLETTYEATFPAGG